jgi:hypothetical protein
MFLDDGWIPDIRRRDIWYCISGARRMVEDVKPRRTGGYEVTVVSYTEHPARQTRQRFRPVIIHVELVKGHLIGADGYEDPFQRIRRRQSQFANCS